MTIKRALNEQEHLFISVQHPFLILTDHQNLMHIKQAKQLIANRPAGISSSNNYIYTLDTRPGSKKKKADSLSHQHSTTNLSSDRSALLVPYGIMATLQCQCTALSTDPAPLKTPPNCLYVPLHCRQQVLRWDHSSTVASQASPAKNLCSLCRGSLDQGVREVFQCLCSLHQVQSTYQSPTRLLEILLVIYNP